MFFHMSQSDIILVGNGRSLMGRGIGATIDAFKTVVRFNNFLTAGFEEHVGTRTDWWARNEVDETFPRPEVFSKILLRLKGEEFEAFQKGCAEVYPDLKARYPKTPIEIVPLSVYGELMCAAGFEHSPLTGTVVASHLLRKHARVHVCGFDNLSGAAENLRHYYSDTATIGESEDWHETDKESAYMNDLIRAGKVVVV